MKTVTALKNAQIFVDGQLQETVEIKNPCQMWKNLHAWHAKYGNGVRILVVDTEDKPYKDFTAKVLKNGKVNLVNAIKETNRVAAAKGTRPAAKPAKKKKQQDDWRKTGIIDGVKLHRIPVEGNGCWYGVGSDSYGYQIGAVAPDGKSFEYLDQDGNVRGTAVLVTNKHAVLKGRYCKMGADGKPYYYKSRGCYYGDLGISDEPGCCPTYLDPSF